jgi:hypothetical protein
VRGRFILRVTGLLAGVVSAVECPATDIVAAERALEASIRVGIGESRCRWVQLPIVERFQDVVAPIAGYLSLLLSAITRGGHWHLAGTAQPRMAVLCAVVLATRKQVAARLLAAPALPVVGLAASFGRGVFAAEARLSRSHQCALWAGPCVAHQGALMRACRPGLRAGVSASVGREANNGLGVGFLAAPAVIRLGLLDQTRVATGAPPTFGLVRAALVLFPFLHLILVPFLDTMKVNNGPANRARPHLGVPQHFVGANDTLVLAVVNIFMDTRR